MPAGYWTFTNQAELMQSAEEKKSVRCENIVAAARGIAETHGKKVVIFVPADEIERITLKFGRSDHRPIVSLAIGVILALVGVFGIVDFFLAPGGIRYQLGMLALGIVGGSLIFDTLKERYFFEVDKKNGMCRLVFPKKAKKEDIDNFCNDARAIFNYHIHDAAPHRAGASGL
jgi:hypothetical protein